jgi:hypothetical protein
VIYRVGMTVERRDRLGEWLVIGLDGTHHVRLTPIDRDTEPDVASVRVSDIRPTWSTPTERLVRRRA